METQMTELDPMEAAAVRAREEIAGDQIVVGNLTKLGQDYEVTVAGASRSRHTPFGLTHYLFAIPNDADEIRFAFGTVQMFCSRLRHNFEKVEENTHDVEFWQAINRLWPSEISAQILARVKMVYEIDNREQRPANRDRSRR
jgi:hypothetical protein